jgi:hypothetical protein
MKMNMTACLFLMALLAAMVLVCVQPLPKSHWPELVGSDMRLAKDIIIKESNGQQEPLLIPENSLLVLDGVGTFTAPPSQSVSVSVSASTASQHKVGAMYETAESKIASPPAMIMTLS